MATNNLSIPRKTDAVINVNISNKDSSPITTGTHTFYLTVRTKYPATSINSDDNAVLAKVITTTVSTVITTLTVSFTFSEEELNIDIFDYVYDVKYTNPNNKTLQITTGTFSITPDSTRGNIT